MKLKLDENFDVRLVPHIAEMGHQAETVLAEGLSGQGDETIYEACQKEARVLITLDLDFSNPVRFPPGATEGIIVLRPPRPFLPVVKHMLTHVLSYFESEAPRGKLWIAEPGRIRVYDPEQEGT